MRYERLKITRDTHTVHNRAVPAWEAPILEYVFEEGNVKHTEVFDEVERDYPDAAMEFSALSTRYGIDKESKLPFAALVYGNAGLGVRALRKAIEQAKADDEEAKRAASPAPAKRSRKGTASAVADSLLS